MTQFVIGKNTKIEVALEFAMANRHGLIAGATGTGKTVTLQKLVEGMSNAGISVFTADVKGDLSGLAKPADIQPKLEKRLHELNIKNYSPQGNPVIFWDLYGQNGHPLRTTVSDMGPLLLGRLLQLNDTQQGVLQLVFSIADDDGLLLIDLKDLRSMLEWTATNAATLKTKYGTLPANTLGILQRKVITLADSCDLFFGEPALDINNLFTKNSDGKGYIHILDATKLISDPQLYCTFLLWLLSELFEKLPEVGDMDKPKLVFFFDEAHLLFNEAPKVLLDKIEQLVRLIRSKGVGVFFVTQSPLDIPQTVLGQLGNRVQHALRAFTPKDQKAVKVAAQTFRKNPQLDTEETITTLGVGEALVSLLDTTGTPSMVERVFILPPASRMGPVTDAERQDLIRHSPFVNVYDKRIDRVSAFEQLSQQTNATEETNSTNAPAEKNEPKLPRGRPRDTLLQTVVKTSSKTLATQIGRQIVRGLLGSIFGKK